MAASVMSAPAHAILVRSSLTEHPPLAQTPTRVTLKFDAAVHVSLSRVFLLTPKGARRPLEIAADKPGEVEVDLPALPGGLYGLEYRIMASDGHWTDEIVRFHVVEGR
jgi:methionine-rich copper-binding protein CopC